MPAHDGRWYAPVDAQRVWLICSSDEHLHETRLVPMPSGQSTELAELREVHSGPPLGLNHIFTQVNMPSRAIMCREESVVHIG